MRLNEFMVVALEGAAKLSGPFVAARLTRLALRLLPDLPSLADHWIVEFDDPLPSGGVRRARVVATLRQFGRRVSGTGHLHDEPTETFAFKGVIRRNVFYGSYRRSDPHVLAGTGTFVLKILSDSSVLEGHCLWYDAVLDDVWVSPYLWLRTGIARVRGGQARRRAATPQDRIAATPHRRRKPRRGGA